MNKVTMLMGLPGSGKTTWAKKQVEKGGVTRINKDDLREMMHNSHHSGKMEKQILKARDSLMIQALRSGHDVIIDDTNLHPKHEDRIKEIVEAQSKIDGKNYKFVLKVFDEPPEVCVNRNKHRSNRVDEKVIWDMWRQYIYKPEPVKQNEKLPQAVVFDLDGTLALIGDRNPYDASECEYDKLNDHVYRQLVKHQEAGYKIIIVSGRSDEYYQQTQKWINKHSIKPDMLVMRKKGDMRKDSIVKREILENVLVPKYFVDLVYDDRNQVVQMWRDAGLVCFQVAEGDF